MNQRDETSPDNDQVGDPAAPPPTQSTSPPAVIPPSPDVGVATIGQPDSSDGLYSEIDLDAPESNPMFVSDLVSIYIDDLIFGMFGESSYGAGYDGGGYEQQVPSMTFLEQLCRDTDVPDTYCRRLYGW